MRGQQEPTGSLFSYVSIEERIPASHPLRRIRKLADHVLDRLNPTFAQLYASEGRPSVPPEQLLLASLLQAFYGIRSERLLLEQLNYNLLFRWFVGLSPDDPIWHPTTFTKNRERLLNELVMGRFLEKLMASPEVKPLLSDEHFSVDGTLLQAWASHASLERIDGQDDPPPPPSGPGEGFGAPKEGNKRAKGDFRGIKLLKEWVTTIERESVPDIEGNSESMDLRRRDSVFGALILFLQIKRWPRLRSLLSSFSATSLRC
jgi:transposase